MPFMVMRSAQKELSQHRVGVEMAATSMRIGANARALRAPPVRSNAFLQGLRSARVALPTRERGGG